MTINISTLFTGYSTFCRTFKSVYFTVSLQILGKTLPSIKMADFSCASLACSLINHINSNNNFGPILRANLEYIATLNYFSVIGLAKLNLVRCESDLELFTSLDKSEGASRDD